MGQVFITKKQLMNLFETGSNSAAMDLDIYVQPVYHDSSNGNDDLIDSCENIQYLIRELKSSLETGKKLSQEQKNLLYRIDDLTKKLSESSQNLQ